MYLREIHTETSITALQQFVRQNPLGILITSIDSSHSPTIQVSHIPWVLDVGSTDDHPGVLRGHLARANPQAKTLIEAAKKSNNAKSLDTQVMVLFNGPHSYVTPKFYVATKPDTGKVVPTWNYAAVQAYGRVSLFYDTSDPAMDTFLSSQISNLSQQQETAMGFEKPWQVSDAPEKCTQVLKKAIIGIEIHLDRLEGKFKMSQEVSTADRQGVIDGFKALETDVGETMSELVQLRSPPQA